MLNKELELTLKRIFDDAKEKRHEFVSVEHLLLFLLDDIFVANILQGCGVNLEILQQNLRFFVDTTTLKIPETQPKREAQPTLKFQRVLQRAVFHVQSAGKMEVTGVDVLTAIFSEQESQAVFLLKKENISRSDILYYITHGVTKANSKEEFSMHPSMDDDFLAVPAEPTALERYATNLNKKAIQGKLDPLVGRDKEIQRTIQILCRRRKNNPLLVGEAGVGKTAIAEGLAKRIIDRQVPDIIAHYVIYSLDLGSLLAGTKYRGDFEKRFKEVLSQLKAEPGAVLFIDEIHTIVGAGAASGGVMDASNLIKPLLTNGELKCIGSTTYQEYRSIFEKDHALARRFQKIDVGEATVEETFEILKGLKERLETHHGVKFSIQALHSAVDLSVRYITDRFLPDKAIDVIDEAGAYQNILSPHKRKKVVGVPEIAMVVSKITQLPLQKISATDRETLKGLEQNLKLLVYGQDEGIEALASSVKLARSGLREPEKPIGCYLFSGPTGVGKTEVSHQLANVLNLPFIRFDMSEYIEKHTISRLIGAPPGYVGYDEGGLLTEAINKQPHCVLLLDEIEKAHPDVFNILLQVMDHGTLTDSNGRKADFRNVILIMTTNTGAAEMSRSSIGFSTQDHSGDSRLAIAQQFSPEFRNRLDAIIPFISLDRKTIHMVVNKFLIELEHQLVDKNVIFEADEISRDWLADRGYDKNMGARPMSRLIQEEIKKPLADELLFGKLVSGGSIKLTVKDNVLVLKVKSKKTSGHPASA